MISAEIPKPLFDSMRRIERTAFGVGVIGLIVCAIGAFLDPNQFFQSYLFAFVFWNGLTIGSLALNLIHNVTGGNWGVVIKRFIEAGSKTIPLNVVLLLPILIFGMHFIYPWAKPEAAHDANIQWKAAYLNIPFFIGRSLVFFAIWGRYAFRLTSLQAEYDRTGDMAIRNKMKATSAFGLLVFTFTASFFFIDLIMSLEPHFFSTMFAGMFLVGQVLEALAFAILMLSMLRKWEPFAGVLQIQHFHDLGNLMLAFTMLWAYTSLSQFLIIWAGNLPTEIPWYLRRFTAGWGYIAWFISIFHFFVPFLLLLMRFVKKNPSLLFKVAAYMLVVRFIDVFWIVVPAFRQRSLYFVWTDLVAPIGVGGVWIAFYLWRLSGRPLLPLKDDRLGYHTLETEAEHSAGVSGS